MKEGREGGRKKERKEETYPLRQITHRHSLGSRTGITTAATTANPTTTTTTTTNGHSLE
jgi:hypothetical protein